MIYCPQCHTANRGGSNFCNHCGASLTGEAGGPPATPVQPQAPQPPPEVAELMGEQPWLAGPEEPQDSVPERPGWSNLLAGLQGTLPTEDWTERLRPAQADWQVERPPQIAPDHLDRLTRPAASWPEQPDPSLARPTGGPPRLLFLLLLLSVAMPLWMATTKPLPPTLPATPATMAAFRTLESLPAGAIVLVAWDFDPTTAGEMSQLADVLVGHALARNPQLITLSLLPAGPPLAQAQIANLMESAALKASEPLLTPPLSLGYLPGGDIALRSLSQDPRKALPSSADTESLDRTLKARDRSLQNLQGIDLLLVLTAEADDGRAWVEQVSSRTDVTTVIGTSAAAGPGLAPYAEAGQVAGLVEGYDGALAYHALRLGDETGQATCKDPVQRPASCAMQRSLFWGQLFLLMILLLGSLAALGSWLRGGPR